jgi:chorismate mutase
MDNRINGIRRRIITLRTEMMRLEAIMRDQINQDLDCTEASLQLLAVRSELGKLAVEWKAAGGAEPLPTVEERLKANCRPSQRTSRPKLPGGS